MLVLAELNSNIYRNSTNVKLLYNIFIRPVIVYWTESDNENIVYKLRSNLAIYEKLDDQEKKIKSMWSHGQNEPKMIK